MGVFSVNENHFGLGSLPEVEMNEAYTTGVDMAIALVECKQNEFAVLQAGIKQDMIAAVTEDLEEREAINEATASELGAKIKEILKKLLEKIKSIFHAFMAKVNSFFVDGEKMFKKYSGEIAKKNFADFKLKVREFKRDKFNNLVKSSTAGNSYKFNFPNLLGYTDDQINDAMESDKLTESGLAMTFTDDANKAMSIDDDLGNLDKEVEEYCFDDAETKDDWSSTTIISSNWIGGLLNTKKFIEDIEKNNKSVENLLQKLLNDIDKEIKKVSGTVGKAGATHTVTQKQITFGGDGAKSKYDNNVGNDANASVGGGDNDEVKTTKLKSLVYVQSYVSRYQTIQIKAQNARLSCAKKAMAQAKKIFAAAVAYNPKKENYDFYTAVAESEEFDAAMALE